MKLRRTTCSFVLIAAAQKVRFMIGWWVNHVVSRACDVIGTREIDSVTVT